MTTKEETQPAKTEEQKVDEKPAEIKTAEKTKEGRSFRTHVILFLAAIILLFFLLSNALYNNTGYFHKKFKRNATSEETPHKS